MKTKRIWTILKAVIIALIVVLIGYQIVKIVQSRFVQPLII